MAAHPDSAAFIYLPTTCNIRALGINELASILLILSYLPLVYSVPMLVKRRQWAALSLGPCMEGFVDEDTSNRNAALLCPGLP